MNGILSNPWFMAGTGILGNPMNPLGGMSQNLMAGAQYQQQAEQQKMLQQYYEMQMAQQRRELEKQKQEEEWMRGMPMPVSHELSQTQGILSPETTDPNAMPNWMMQSPDLNVRLKAYEMMNKRPDPYQLDAGDVLIDPNTYKQLATAPFKSDVLTPEALAQKIQLATAGRSSTNVNVGGADPLDAIPSVSDLIKYRDKNGNPPPGPMSHRELREKGYTLSDVPTEKDKVASYVADSLTTASSEVDKVLSKPDFNPSSFDEFAKNITNWTASPNYQQYKSAADEWATNLVFLRSGATARQEEKDAAFNNYWPQPGDKPETRKFKEKFRKAQEINAYSMAAMGGRVSKEKAEEKIKQLQKEIDVIDTSTDTSTMSDDELFN